VIEWFVPIRHFALVIAPVFLMIALPDAVGSVAWERTRSIVLSVIAGVWCALVAMLVGLCFAFSVKLAFEARAELRLHEALAPSGMSDPGAFLVKNSLEAASEGLVRMPILALFLSLNGALANSWITGRTRNIALSAAGVTPIMFAMSAAALWHADSLERAAWPPFVVFGGNR
jgi:hypothetical protein